MEEKKVIESKEKSCCSSKDGKGKHMKHGLMMMLCCLLPIVIIAALPLIGFKNLSWTGLIFLLCPLMHIGMMFFMKEKKH